MRRIFGHGRYANVTATLALVVALGGTSYAAVTITGKNIKNGSIKRVDLGNNSVTSAKVKNGSLTSRDLKAGVLAGVKGPKGDKGDKGEPGQQGPPGVVTGTAPLVTELSSGQTVRGYANAAAEPEAADELTTVSVSFPIPLPAPPTPHYIGAANPVCPGTAAAPAAAPGHLCVYQAEATNVNVASPAIVGLTRFGFTLQARNAAGMTGGTPFNLTTHWAATAG